RPVCFDCCERIAHDLFDCDNEELWADVRLHSLPLGYLLELRYHRTGAKRAYACSGSVELGSKRFRETCHIRFCGGVNSRKRDRKKTSRRADVKNGAAMLCDHGRKQMTGDQRQRRDIYERHFLVSIGIALGKGTAVAQPGIIDQEIDVEFVAIKRFEESPQLAKIGEIDFANVNNKFRMLSLQSISQFDQ